MNECILLLNCGSSSIKYQMFDVEAQEPTAVGLVERIGIPGGVITHTKGTEEHVLTQDFADHSEALAAVVGLFDEHGPDLKDAIGVGHRTVHGGDEFRESVLIDDKVIAKLHELSGLAPLHNPPGIAGIEGAMEVLPDVPHVAIFDTAFFTSLPAEAYTYAVAREVREQYGVRKYGFHGTSHRYVSHATADFLGRPVEDLKLIICHLGNGASISAVDGGKAIETSMGLTPLQGLVMGTRSGDVDPGLPAFLAREGWTPEAVDTMLNKQSGMMGLCGLTDMRDITAAIDNGNEEAMLAMQVYVHRLVSYIGAYHVLLGGADALVFTAGIGENVALVRERVANRLAVLGVQLDPNANQQRSKEPRVISSEQSAMSVLVVPTNEELQMAADALSVIRGE